ncbi:MAG: UDP-N-acetylmuramate--L-alanine ligase [Saprospiraceae bacterium]|nr:UDP-N-acetylmuramate--L-alanine ligase [Saprospiraceae bacterium]
MTEMKGLKNVFFLGIGGIGMSALARYFHKRGVHISGYDRVRTPLTEKLEAEGMKIVYRDEVKNIDIPDLVVYTPAIPSDSVLRKYFKESGVPMMKRSQVLGNISDSERTIAIAGTHGKTTTSAMTTHILYHCGVKVTGFVGGIMTNYDSNYIDDGSDYVVVEADEFDHSFLTLSPYISAVLSMDPDHLDIYGAREEVKKGFKDFIHKTIPGGTVYQYYPTIANFTHQELELLHKTYTILTFGHPESDIFAENIRQDESGGVIFDFHYKTQLFKGVQVHMPGMHNVSNATVAMSIALQLGLEPSKVIEAIGAFRGIKRRFEFIVNRPDCIYIDDYAHHPEELRNAITTVKNLYPDNPVMGIFQPHLYSRTRDFADEFATVLDMLDKPVLLDIYPARELPIENVSSKMILDKMSNPEKQLIAMEEVCAYVAGNRPGVLITLGAGNIDTLVPQLKKLLA